MPAPNQHFETVSHEWVTLGGFQHENAETWALELDPAGKHISLGGDLDGCETLPDGFSGIQDYPKLVQRLFQRGLDEDILRNIFWNNALGVMKRCST